MSATVNVLRALTRTEGDTFQVRPRSRAAPWPVPSVAMPPLPFSPLKFSGLIDRDCASESRERLPRCRSRPSKWGVTVCAPAIPQLATTVTTVQDRVSQCTGPPFERDCLRRIRSDSRGPVSIIVGDRPPVAKAGAHLHGLWVGRGGSQFRRHLTPSIRVNQA